MKTINFYLITFNSGVNWLVWEKSGPGLLNVQNKIVSYDWMLFAGPLSIIKLTHWDNQ
jgi:hypothetical protein